MDVLGRFTATYIPSHLDTPELALQLFHHRHVGLYSILCSSMLCYVILCSLLPYVIWSSFQFVSFFLPTLLSFGSTTACVICVLYLLFSPPL